jgi:hypothetical protein
MPHITQTFISFEKLAKLVLTIKDIEICGLKSENVKMQISDFLKHHHKSMYVLFLFSVIHSLCNSTASGGAAEGRKGGSQIVILLSVFFMGLTYCMEKEATVG